MLKKPTSKPFRKPSRISLFSSTTQTHNICAPIAYFDQNLQQPTDARKVALALIKMSPLLLQIWHPPSANRFRSAPFVVSQRRWEWLIIAMLCMTMAGPVRANSLLLPGRHARIPLSRTAMQIFCDPLHQHTIQSVQNAQFEFPAHDIPTFGYTTSSYWVRLRLTNTDLNTRWWLHYNWVFADTIEFYTPLGHGEWKMTRTGFALPFHTRPLRISTFAFPLDFQAYSEQEVYLRVSSSAPLAIHLLSTDS